MIIETLLFKEINLLSEFFLAISIIYLTMYGTLLSINKTYPLIQTSMLNLILLIFFFSGFLLVNDKLTEINIVNFNCTITQDYLSFFSKTLIIITSAVCLLMVYQYLINQNINQFEYLLLFLFGILGILLLCSSNDLLTAYLAIELQSLAFYVLAAFKKNSTFSIDAGLKYFILGAFSSSLFLFGSSIIYGLTGSITFTNLQNIFFWIYPGSSCMLNYLEEYKNYKLDLLAVNFLIENLFTSHSNEILLTNLQDNNKILEQFTAEFIDKVFLFETFSDYKTRNIFVINVIQLLEYISTELEYSWLNTTTHNNIFYYKTFDVTLVQFAIIFIFVSLFFKLALAPFHLWSPDVYEGSLSSSTFFFAVVPKLGVFILLIRLFYCSLYGFIDYWRYYVIGVSILSILIGSVVGLEQRKIKSLLAYSSISHMGYSLIAFSSGTFEGLQLLISYLVIYMCSGLCMWSLFLIIRIKRNYPKKQNKDLTDFVMLNKSNKIIAIVLATVLLSIAGFPPMIGFLVKVGIFLAALESSMFFVTLFAILISVISTFYYIRIIKVVFFEKVLVGHLYYPITFQRTFLISGLFYSLIFLFMNPTLLYVSSYKISLTLL